MLSLWSAQCIAVMKRFPVQKVPNFELADMQELARSMPQNACHGAIVSAQQVAVAYS